MNEKQTQRGMRRKYKIIYFVFASFVAVCLFFIYVCGKSPNVFRKKMIRYERKINEYGEYLPFYGYTSIAYIEPNAKATCNQIETFINTSSLKRYYAPLPASTYHMTIFTVYCISCFPFQPIPAVQRWMEKTNQVPPVNGWLPEKVLETQHIRAYHALSTVAEQTHIVSVEPYLNYNLKGTLGMWLTLDEKSNSELVFLRKSFSEIYEHQDSSLQGDCEKIKWHLTFGYKYKELPDKNSLEWPKFADDIEILIKMASKISNYTLVKPNIYLFSSMDTFIPLQLSMSHNLPIDS